MTLPSICVDGGLGLLDRTITRRVLVWDGEVSKSQREHVGTQHRLVAEDRRQ